MPETTAKPVVERKRHGLSRYYFLPWPIKILFLAGPVVALILFVLHKLSVPVFGTVLAAAPYYYLLYAALGFNVFMGLGATRKQRQQSPPWFDYLMAVVLWGMIIYFLCNAKEIGAENWIDPPGTAQYAAALVIGILSIEAGRRIGGWGFVAILLVSIVYPLFSEAEWLPDMFYGISFSFDQIVGSYAFGSDGMLGLPARTLGELVLGFYFFAGVMMGMGGGEFFLKLSTAVAGRYRGGPAKVAVIASGFFGSLSGSIVANIAGTGSFTIPAMKRMGYPPEYAAAIETCASTGGDTMPPVMGGLVFIMVIVAGVDYADVLVAAFLPTFLHYFSLLIQVDSFAARTGLKGLPREEIPKIWPVLRQGWLYLVVLFFLIFGLVYMRWGEITPVYAVGLTWALLIIQWLVRRTREGVRGENSPEMALSPSLRRGWERLETSLVQSAGLINYGAAVFLGMAFILVGLYKTGVAYGITATIISLGGENIYLILFITVVFCLIMGMVGLQRASYLFLAVTVAPALVALGAAAPAFADVGGISVIAVHLFIIFYSGLGGFTPPVALHAFIAAGIAGAHPMKTAWLSMRLGVVLIFVPFFFVLQPALLMINQPWYDVLLHLGLAMLGIWLLASGLEKYLIGIGKLLWPMRVVLIVGGFLVAFPQWILTYIGFGMIALVVLVGLWLKRRRVAEV